jgi:hypothetical protein
MATVSGTTEATLRLAMERVNARYDDNVAFNQSGSNFHRGGIRPRGGSVLAFSLTVKDSRGPGARVSAGINGQKQRRIRAACWHVWRDFLAELFELAPKAVVRTALATYRGRDGFERDFPATYYRNSGSLMEPRAYGDLCNHYREALTASV